MKIALIQDEIYLPSLGGGTKANRYLLEELVRRGHDCVAFTRALTSSSDGPNDIQQYSNEMGNLGIVVHEAEPGVFTYTNRGVQVEALNFEEVSDLRDCLVRRIRSSSPDWIFVTDDKRRFMLPAAAEAFPSRVILLLQTIIQLPFGPLSVDRNTDYTELVRNSKAIVVISRFMQHYIHEHGDLDAYLLPMPVYGTGPFPDLAKFDTGFVTMINPCELKGMSIFLGLARSFPDVEFAAVPTWGARPEDIERMREFHNIRMLKPAEDIEEILRQTRILLVPSLWPETFGYVVPEAMLRGIPVLASDVGGLPEAKLGVDYTLPVRPGEFRKEGFFSPPQDISPWAEALEELLNSQERYMQCSRQSRQAAHDFVSNISVSRFEELMDQLADDR